MDADAMSGVLAAAAGVARGNSAPEFDVADCNVTILPGYNRIHANVPTYLEIPLLLSNEARLRAILAAYAIGYFPVCTSNLIQIPVRHGS